MRFHSDSTSKTSPRARLAARRNRSVGRAARQVVEQLESRQLLAVINAGETGTFYNGTAGVRISVVGEGAITLTGMTRPREGQPGRTGLAELPMTVTGGDEPQIFNGGFFTGQGTSIQPPIYEIYSILSGNSTSNTSVVITTFNVQNGAVNAFGGGAGVVDTSMLDPGDTDPSVTLGGGGVFIGGRQGTQDALAPVYELVKARANGDNISIATSPGVSLKKGATLKPGVYIDGSLDQFLIGGTLLGAVSISGSVDTFYASNILTGDVVVGENSSVIGTDNFFVGGDLRNLLAADGIGTTGGAPDAFTVGTDIQVGGRIQQVKAGGNMRASIDAVGNFDKSISDGSVLTELEFRTATNVNAAGLGQLFQNFQITNQGFANNDSFNTPQILGSYYSPERDRGAQVQVAGTLNNLPNVGDAADFYGLPMLAGQSAVVQVETDLLSSFGPVALQVYDPDGNIVYSDYSNQNAATFLNKAFTIKADQPGLWRLAVVPESTSLLTSRAYTLTVDKAGEMAIGGVQAGGEIFLSKTSVGIRGRNADVGAVLAGGDLYSNLGLTTANGQPAVTNPIISDKGSVRSVEADNFAFQSSNGTLFTDTFPTILAAKTVGLVRTSVGRLFFNQYGRAADDTPSINFGIGGDYQVVETPGDFSAVLSANGGIGVIRVGSIGTDLRTLDPGYFEINADAEGNDGVIGLIDVAGDMGTFGTGGPAIRGGQGSNVRYIRVRGNAYRDRFFGAGNTIVQTSTNAALPNILDDSGAQITITPIATSDFIAPEDEEPIDPNDPDGGLFGNNVVPSPFGNTTIPDPFGRGTTLPTTDTNGDGVIDEDDLPVPGDIDGDGDVDADDGDTDGDGDVDEDDDPLIPPSTLTVETYPIRTGGSAILNVTSSAGVSINTTGSGATAAGDIAELFTGSGTAVINTNSDPTLPTSEETPASLASGTTLQVLLTGARTNIFFLGSGTPTRANYTRVVNSTDGEIVNVTAADVGYIEAFYLGTGRTAANVTVEGRTATADTRYVGIDPVVPLRNLVQVDNAIDVRARGVLGNVASAGVIQNAVANSDDANTKGLFEGIAGVVYANSELRNVEIGEGLATSGTGNLILAGLYSSDTIGTISNAFGNGDLRGDVLARQNVEAINIGGGGSIVDADILQVGNIETTVTVNGVSFSALGAGNEQFETTIELVGGFNATSGIGTLNVEGLGGGIINSQIVGLNIGLTTVGAGGFGVVNSRFFSSGGGRMEGISAAGLGIRGSIYTGGGTMGDIVATGGGRLADLDDYTLSARGSDIGYFDAATGIAPNTANDLYLYFETSEADSAIVGETNEGIIADTNIAASQSIENIRGFDIRSIVNPLGIRPRDESFPMQINFGQSIGSITTKRDINGLRVVGAALGSLVARDIKNFQLQTTGAVGTINAKRNITGSVNFNIINEGSLNKLAVGGYMNGTLFAARGIDTVIVDGDLASQRESGGLQSGLNIRSIRIGGDVREGSYIRARKKLSGITINGDLEANATLRAGTFGKVTIKGSTDGKVQTP